MQKAIIVISAFPGTGKTYFAEKLGSKYKIADSDSSKYSTTPLGDRNIDFPTNYIAHIKKLMKEGYQFILVSSHKEVRVALKEAGINFIAVYPPLKAKKEYIRRYRERGNTEIFIKLLSNNWEAWIKDMQQEPEHMEMFRDYLTDIFG